MIRRSIPLFLFLSGFCSLVYQTVWLREFRLIFGASTLATAAVLSIFMAGLGAGSAFLGRRADKHPNGLAYYGKLEVLIAATAALSPLLTFLVRKIYYATGGSGVLGDGGATVVRLVLSVIVISIPTFLMGGTLPAATRSALAASDTSRRKLALLYGVNTLGAVAGTLVSTFWLLELFGNAATLAAAVVLNALVGALAIAASRGIEDEADEVAGEAPASYSLPAPAAFTYVAAFITGFTFLLMELVWYRMLAPLLGGSTFTFGMILAVALLGVALGGIAYAFAASEEQPTLRHFATTCALEALAIAIPFALGDRLALFTALLHPLQAFGFSGQVISWMLVCVITVLPAAIVAGYQFPLVVALIGRARHEVGAQLGRVYAWNTAGAIAGSLAGGFGLLPLLGALASWRLATFTMLALAAVAVTLAVTRQRRFGLAATAIGVAAVLAITATGPTAAWRHTPIGAGRVQFNSPTPNMLLDWLNTRRRVVVWEADGVESSVALTSETAYSFVVNGKIDGNSRLDAGTQVMSGLLASILHPAPRTSLVIGLGTGSTAGWLGRVPGMQRVDVYELEPAIRRVAADTAAINADVLRNPVVHIDYGDARELLLTTRKRYDIIFSEPSNPYRAGIASLFTAEYYEAVADRLEKGGFFVQWVQAYEIDAETIRTIYATMRRVFPHIQSWQTSAGDLVLLAANQPVLIDIEQIRRRASGEPYRTALTGAWRVATVEGFLAHFVANEKYAQQMALASRVNTDDQNFVEFGFARTVGKSGVTMQQLRALAAETQTVRPQHIRGNVDWNAVDEAIAISPVIRAKPSTFTAATNALTAAAADYHGGAWEPAAAALDALARPPRFGHEVLVKAYGYASGGDERVLRLLPYVARFQPIEADIVSARYLATERRWAEAADALVRAATALRGDPWPAVPISEEVIPMALDVAGRANDPAITLRLFDAVSEPFALDLHGEAREYAKIQLARMLDRNGCSKRSIEALAEMEPYPIWRRDMLERRVYCYDIHQHPLAVQAREDLDRFRANEAAPIGPTP